MSFFRRNNDSQPAIPPVQDYNAGPNKLQRPPPQDRYASSGSQQQQQYGGGGDRYGAAPPDRYGAAPDRYGAAPDRYGAAPDRYGQQQQQPDRYGAAPDRYGSAPDRYGQQQPPPQQQRYGGPPPPQQQQQQPDRYGRSGPPPDRYGGAPPDRYGQNPSPAPSGPSQQRRPNASDPYSRGGADVDADRAALFAGRNPDAPKRLGQDGTRFKSEAEWDQQREEGGNEEEDVEAIKSSIRQTKQESLASTRNALRIAREAEETGMNTLLKLGDQSEKLGDSEQHIDMAKYNSMKAADKVDELKQLNKSIFRPVIVFNKDKKRAAQEQKLLSRHNEARDERERNAAEVRATQARIGNVAMSSHGGGSGYGDDGYGQGGDEGLAAPVRGGGYRTQQQDSVRKEQRKRFQFEATGSDDELEDELDDNLDGIANAVANMKKLGLAMGQEVDRQNDRLKKFEVKVDDAEQRVVTNTNRMRKF